MGARIYEGGCHCRALRYQLKTRREPLDWSIRACQCRFCRMHDALSSSDPEGCLKFRADAGTLQRYRFALQTADFLLCRVCGVYVGAVIETPSAAFGIINTHTLDDTFSDLAAVEPISYDNEDQGGRVNRRAERWTPVATLPW